MTKQNESSRRLFLKQAVALSALSAFPVILTKAMSGVNAPLAGLASAGERVNLACCGCGNQGGSDIKSLYDTGLCNIVALCDTDMGAPHTAKTLEKFPDVPRFQDFRKMFDKMSNQIDAVLVGVPDHSHFPITMMALALGKHVYVEKPMGRTFNEV
jgi:predicted dehydrogenase